MQLNLRAYEMVQGASPDEISLMKQQRRIEEAQRIRRQRRAAELQRPAKRPSAPQRRDLHA